MRLLLVAGLPRCTAWLDHGEGHFFFRRRVREILGALVESSVMPAPGRGSAP